MPVDVVPIRRYTGPLADSVSVAARSQGVADDFPPYAVSGGVPLLDNPLPGALSPPAQPSRAYA